jgi:uncharacterized membrane protein YhiD involved in acid resistance
VTRAAAAVAVLLLALASAAPLSLAADRGNGRDAIQGVHQEPPSPEASWEDLKAELSAAAVRLPLAAALGAALALRPRRRGTPERQPVVIQTQIVLAVVGAVIMLVVGASLARAFGIVGVASLVRYRSKIDDPKDAVVMLSALAVGLAAGAGLYALASFATLFLFLALFVSESFQPERRRFELSIKLGEKTASLRPKVEEVLRHYRVEFELRTASEEEVLYFVSAALSIETDQVSNALIALAPDGKGAVEWKEKPKIKSP